MKNVKNLRALAILLGFFAIVDALFLVPFYSRGEMLPAVISTIVELGLVAGVALCIVKSAKLKKALSETENGESISGKPTNKLSKRKIVYGSIGSVAIIGVLITVISVNEWKANQEDRYRILQLRNTELQEELQKAQSDKQNVESQLKGYVISYDNLEKDYKKLEEDTKPYLEMTEAEREAVQKAAEEKKAQEEAKRQEEEAKGYETGITFEDISRSPDKYKGKKVKFSGNILQVITGYSTNQARMSTSGNYDDVILIEYKNDIIDVRLLEDDDITICGTFKYMATYETVIGGSVTLPFINVDIISLGNETGESSETSQPNEEPSYTPLYDDQFVNISFCGIEKHSGKECVVYMVENKNDFAISAWDFTVALDGVDLGDMSGSGDISPKSKGKVYIYKYDSENPNIENKKPSIVSGSLIVNSNGSEKINGERYHHISFTNISVG